MAGVKMNDIETRLQKRLDIEPDTLYSDALTAIQGARALNVEYAAALELCERQVTELMREIERMRFGDVTAEEEEADRVALKRFQEHLGRQLREAEEKGRVATRIEWRGYLRKAIMRERELRKENARLQTIVTAARAVHTAYHGDPAVVSLAAAWAALEAALEEAGDGA